MLLVTFILTRLHNPCIWLLISFSLPYLDTYNSRYNSWILLYRECDKKISYLLALILEFLFPVLRKSSLLLKCHLCLPILWNLLMWFANKTHPLALNANWGPVWGRNNSPLGMLFSISQGVRLGWMKALNSYAS